MWYFQKFCFPVFVDYADTYWNSCWLRGHTVGVVIDYVDTTMTTRTLLEKLLRLLTDFKGTVRQKKVFRYNSNNLKIWKPPYLKKKLRAIEYLRENDKFCETVFVCSYGAQVEFFKAKKWSEISWHCFFKEHVQKYRYYLHTICCK